MTCYTNFRFAIVTLLSLIACHVAAQTPDPSPPFASPTDRVVEAIEKLEDPALEARAVAITKQLRCPTCVSQSVYDSDVGISVDLKTIVRERLLIGDTDQQILNYVSSRYGEFVLLKPDMTGGNIYLWATPFVVFSLVIGVWIWRRRQTTTLSAQTKLNAEEEDTLKSIIDDE